MYNQVLRRYGLGSVFLKKTDPHHWLEVPIIIVSLNLAKSHMNNKYCFSLKDKTNFNILVLYCAKIDVKLSQS